MKLQLRRTLVRSVQRAAAEYLESVVWYKERSEEAAKDFIKVINEKIDKIEKKTISFVRLTNNFTKLKPENFRFQLFILLMKRKS
ncbi:MAG: hypothetical protein KGL19_16230 [Bacteroidota bacterium]|nr:hypothetical protein [Bacteroidota bacterium]